MVSKKRRSRRQKGRSRRGAGWLDKIMGRGNQAPPASSGALARDTPIRDDRSFIGQATPSTTPTPQMLQKKLARQSATSTTLANMGQKNSKGTGIFDPQAAAPPPPVSLDVDPLGDGPTPRTNTSAPLGPGGTNIAAAFKQSRGGRRRRRSRARRSRKARRSRRRRARR